MASKPAFAATPKQGSAAVTSPDTSFVTPTNVATVYTAPAGGAVVQRLRVNFAATTSGAGLVNIFIHDGTAYRLLRSIVYGAVTVSTTVPPALTDGSGVINFDGGLLLPQGYSIRVSYTVGTGNPPLHGTADVGEFV